MNYLKNKLKFVFGLIFDKGSSLILLLILFSFFFFSYKNIKPVFEPESRFLSYNELPLNIKKIIYEFEIECYKRKIDISQVRKIKYVLVNSPKTDWGGYNGHFAVFLNLYNSNDYRLRHLVWHELGHRILSYGHDVRPETSHIMNSGRSNYIYSNWEDQKKQFFNEPIKKYSVDQFKHAFSSNNYLYFYMKDKFLLFSFMIQEKFKIYQNKIAATN